MKKRNVFDILYNWIIKYGIYIFAIGVAVLNVSLCFDNVVWGDEAFSGKMVLGTGFAGIYQRVYYWENHPPLYYFYLKIWEYLLGHKTYVFHLASVFTFLSGCCLSLTVIKKKVGSVPVAFFIAISGLSMTCAEYNQEIRMYGLCFFFVLGSCMFSYMILGGSDKKAYWGAMVVFGALSAYTHYYGLVCTGLLVFSTSLMYYLKKKGKTWINGVLSIVLYIVLYIPWLTVFFKQLKMVGGSWWITKPDSLERILNFAFGGGVSHKIIIPAWIILLLIFIALEFKVLQVSEEKESFILTVKKPNVSKSQISDDAYALFAFLMAIVLTFVFGYIASYTYNPIFIARYSYPMIPLLLFAFMICIKRVVETAGEKNGIKKYVLITSLFVLFVFTLAFCLKDFKDYRTRVKVEQDVTDKTLSLIGKPNEDTVFTSLAVQHLAWTVLEYYYPENEIIEGDPSNIDINADEVWSFLGYPLSDDSLETLRIKGYEVDYYPDTNFGKYSCNLYHLKKQQ